MRLISGTVERGGDYSAATNVSKLSLDDLFEEANKLGRLETGGIFSNGVGAEIKLEGVGDSYLLLKCRRHHTLKENLAECIHMARAIKDFYRTNFG